MTEAVNMANYIAPKSDQLNADDLIGGNRTIRITGVRASPDTAEQPISIHFEGDDNKPFKPCKSMRRVMVAVWGADAGKYVGRCMTLYRDPSVKFGGMQVGGIRISHMSDIGERRTMALTETRAKRAPFTVEPLTEQPPTDAAERWAAAYVAKLAEFTEPGALQAFVDEKAKRLAELKDARPSLHERVDAAIVKRRGEIAPASGFDDDDLTRPATAGASAAAEQSDADAAVEKVIADLKAAGTKDELEAVIAEAERHKAFLADKLQIKLEIAFDENRQRFAEEVAL